MAAAGSAGSSASNSLAAVDLSGLGERWDTFVSQLQAYDSNLEVQRHSLQGLVQKKLQDFEGVVAGFASRCGVWFSFAKYISLLLAKRRKAWV